MKTVAYLDGGISNAREFWNSVVLPDVEDFKSKPSDVRLSLHAAWSLWHLLDWLWHDRNPGVDTRGNPEYDKFKNELITQCPELAWLRDLADAAKHRGLGRNNVGVERLTNLAGYGGVGGYNIPGGGYGVGPFALGSGQPERAITLKAEGSIHWLKDVINKVFDFWKFRFFLDQDSSLVSLD